MFFVFLLHVCIWSHLVTKTSNAKFKYLNTKLTLNISCIATSTGRVLIEIVGNMNIILPHGDNISMALTLLALSKCHMYAFDVIELHLHRVAIVVYVKLVKANSLDMVSFAFRANQNKRYQFLSLTPSLLNNKFSWFSVCIVHESRWQIDVSDYCKAILKVWCQGSSLFQVDLLQ